MFSQKLLTTVCIVFSRFLYNKNHYKNWFRIIFDPFPMFCLSGSHQYLTEFQAISVKCTCIHLNQLHTDKLDCYHRQINENFWNRSKPNDCYLHLSLHDIHRTCHSIPSYLTEKKKTLDFLITTECAVYQIHRYLNCYT